MCLALSFTLAPSQIYAWIGVVFAAVMLGGLGSALGPLVAGIVIGVSEAVTMAVTVAVVGADRVVLAADRRAAAPAREDLSDEQRPSSAIAGRRRRCWPALPWLGLPAFYESFLYLVLPLDRARHVVEHPVRLLGLLLVRPRRVLRRRRVHDRGARRQAATWPFLWTLPLRGAGAGAARRRARRGRLPRAAVRGELFALLTLAVTFVLATIVLNTPIDGGPGVYLSAVAVPKLAPSPSSTFYLLALARGGASRC